MEVVPGSNHRGEQLEDKIIRGQELKEPSVQTLGKAV